MHFDDTLKILGELGKYQKIRLILVCLFGFACSFHSMNMVFVGAKPKFRCKIPSVNITSLSDKNISEVQITKLLRTEDDCKVRSSIDTVNMLVSGNLSVDQLQLGKVAAGKCQSWIYSREIYGPTIVTQFDLVCDNGWLRSISKTLYFFGRLIGAVIIGQLSDIFGRKPMVFLNLALLVIAGCGASASPSFYFFIPFYILQGAAQTGLFLVVFTIGTELVGPSFRLYASFLVHTAYSFGIMVMAFIAYLIRDWRYIELTITLPVLLFIPSYWVLPESVRWLLSRNRGDMVRNILSRVAQVNKVHLNENTLEEMSIPDEITSKQEEKKQTFVDLFRPGIVLLSLNVWFNWMVNSLLYYGITLGTGDIGGDPYINLCLAGAVDIPANILCMIVLNRLGRKKPLLTALVVAGGACIASGFIVLVPLKITFAMIAKFCISSSYSIIYLMAAEVFPTVVRNIGMGTSSMSARIGGMLSPQILELSRFWGPLPMVIFGGMSILAGLLVVSLPETLGKQLPQTIEDVIARNRKRRTEVVEMSLGRSKEYISVSTSE